MHNEKTEWRNSALALFLSISGLQAKMIDLLFLLAAFGAGFLVGKFSAMKAAVKRFFNK
jgi:hypothetical protein